VILMKVVFLHVNLNQWFDYLKYKILDFVTFIQAGNLSWQQKYTNINFQCVDSDAILFIEILYTAGETWECGLYHT